MNRWERVSVDEGIYAGIDAFSDAYKTGEPQAAIQTFFAAKAKHKAGVIAAKHVRASSNGLARRQRAQPRAVCHCEPAPHRQGMQERPSVMVAYATPWLASGWDIVDRQRSRSQQQRAVVDCGGERQEPERIPGELRGRGVERHRGDRQRRAEQTLEALRRPSRQPDGKLPTAIAITARSTRCAAAPPTSPRRSTS